VTIKNIIFDWSGTLVNDLPPVMEATNYCLRNLGKPTLTLEGFRAEFCLPFSRFYERVAPEADPKQLEAWFHESFIPMQDDINAIDHAEDYLRFVKEHGLQTFLFSSVHRRHYNALTLRIPFAQYLDHPYVEVWNKKKRIQELIQTHHIQPAETIFIGDMIHDIETAQFGCIHSCAVLTGYTRLVDLKTSNPELIVEDLSVLQSLMESAGMDWNAILAEAKRRGLTGK
jgi:phosphoglycolate phosphatase